MSRIIFALVLLVGVSGCLGTLVGGPTLDTVSYPQGVNETGLEAVPLAKGHNQALDNRSFTVEIKEATRVNGTLKFSKNESVAVGEGWDEVTLSPGQTTHDQEANWYVTATGIYRKVERGGTRFSSRTLSPDEVVSIADEFTNEMNVENHAASADYTPTAAKRVDGTTVIALSADFDDIGYTGFDHVTDYSGTIHVDQKGIVRLVDVELAAEEDDGDPIEYEFRMEISKVGRTTITEPAWVDEARETSKTTD